MDYFDLHCDTATELYDRGETLSDNTCHIKSGYAREFERYGQVFAVFSKQGTSDDLCYDRFFKVVDRFESANGAEFRLTAEDLREEGQNFILSVEDARLLAGDARRVRSLFDRGVRLITPLWAGVSCIGGSFDTDEGLSRFGKEVVDECLKFGIITDVSHASGRSADEILSAAETYGAAVIASHSDSYSVNPHPRNITDERARKVARTGGIIGVCLHSPHLSSSGANVCTIFEHVDRLICETDEKHVAIGADFDGTDALPDGISSQRDVYFIANEMLKHNYSQDTVDRITFGNAYDFFKNNLPKRRNMK